MKLCNKKSLKEQFLRDIMNKIPPKVSLKTLYSLLVDDYERQACPWAIIYLNTKCKLQSHRAVMVHYFIHEVMITPFLSLEYSNVSSGCNDMEQNVCRVTIYTF